MVVFIKYRSTILYYYMYSNDVMSNATCNVTVFSTICTEIML